MTLTARSPWVAVIILNVSLVFLHFAYVTLRGYSRSSFIGDDFPIAFYPGHLDPVAMSLYDSLYFKIEPGNDQTRRRWRSIISHPLGQGRAHMGPNDRVFSTTFAHQLHCLVQMQEAFQSRNSTMTHAHIQHCLNYLRQTLLCAATDSLEKGDFLEVVSTENRIENSLVCWDWERLYSEMDVQWLTWMRTRKEKET